MSKPSQSAAYCGLFCESCSLYVATQEEPERLVQLAKRYGKTVDEVHCNGCRSDVLSFYCGTCKIKTCIRAKGLDFCVECNEYPCAMLTEFQALMPHRAELFDSLAYIKENGYDCWREKMKKDYSCEECGTINPTYDMKCRKCGHTPPNPFTERNMARIMETVDRYKKREEQ